MTEIKKLEIFEVEGKRFDNYNEAVKYGYLCDKVSEVMAPLKHGDKPCTFRNGHGSIQHDPVTVTTARTAITKLAKEMFPLCNSDGMLPRWADDNDVLCLNKAFYLLASIAEDGKEYGQPYYVAHPEEVR